MLASMAPPHCRDVSPHSLPTARTSETASALSILVLAALRYGRTEPLLPESSPKPFPLPGVVREPGIIERVQLTKGRKKIESADRDDRRTQKKRRLPICSHAEESRSRRRIRGCVMDLGRWLPRGTRRQP